jgi:hypothetical protein
MTMEDRIGELQKTIIDEMLKELQKEVKNVTLLSVLGQLLTIVLPDD